MFGKKKSFTEQLAEERAKAQIPQKEVTEVKVEDTPPMEKPMPKKIVVQQPKTNELDQTDMAIAFNNLTQDEDVQLYLKVLAGEKKYETAKKLEEYLGGEQ